MDASASSSSGSPSNVTLPEENIVFCGKKKEEKKMRKKKRVHEKVNILLVCKIDALK